MLRLFLYLLLLFSFSVNCVAQKSYYTQGMQVTEHDLQSTTYSKDTTANAFYIYEKGYSRIIKGDNNYLQVATDYERKIKILNKEGYDKTKIEIYLYKGKSGSEKIKNLVAQTYNIDNENIIETPVKEDNIYTEPHSESLDVVRFTFPDLKPGSVIKYSYQIVSPYVYNFNGWNFQDDIPKQYSEYISDLPGNYIYNIRLIGTLKLTTEENSVKKKCLKIDYGVYADCSHNKYTMEDIPAFKEEKYMTAKKNYFSRVAYELKEFKGFNGINKKFTETWKDVDTKLKKLNCIGLQLKKINATKSILPLDISSSSNNLEKAKKIYTYLTNNYTWDKKYQIFSKTNIKEIIKTKTGNIGSINILLNNILKQQGFSVKPVLLSTRKNGYATKIHPVLSDFNYVLVQLTIDNKTYLLDATEKNIAFGEIPFRCLNKYGRLLDFKNGSSWIDISSEKNRSSLFYSELIKLNEESELIVESKQINTGYHGISKRLEFEKMTKDKSITEATDHITDIEILSSEIINDDKLGLPFIQKVTHTQQAEKIDGIIYIKPFSNPFFTKNPFKLNKRTYPVDFGYKDFYTYIVSIEIPENHQFMDIPKNQSYALPNKLGRLTVNYSLQGNKLSISHNISFLSTYYSSTYYESLKQFFVHIVDIENNTVITVKKD